MTDTPSPGARFYPSFLKLRHARVLVVGGGEVALRKVRLLLPTQARIELIARELHAELAALLPQQTHLVHLAREFTADAVKGCRLVIATTDDARLNAEVAAAADAEGIFVNVVDDPAHSSFITPSVVQRPPITIAITTEGAAPVLARRLRERLEALLPSGLGAVAHFMAQAREEVRRRMPVALRRRVWEQFLDGAGAERILSGDELQARVLLEGLLAQTAVGGEVYLVGAGPGDPDLLTLRALRLMQQADVVLHDRLLGPGILDLVRRDAERIDVGKQRNNHTLPQVEINALLVRLAREGKRVLRLKGGDPFVFGRGGEEIETLAAEGIPFQVVPGVTAANGCAAYAGIPLTHRDYAQSCIFVTGHPRADGSLSLSWSALAQPGQTVVIYMGRGSLDAICARLIEHGLPADWPAALIEEGTLPEQRVLTGSLQTLPELARSAAVSGASLVIVGEVVRLRERLRWFGRAEGTAAADAAAPRT